MSAVQTLWAELIATTLADAGVRTCVISPGSRSTPLVLALARVARCELPTIIDERAAAFFGLGVARATGAPVALVCTSGSAAAHYMPALVEASMAGIPLIAITADRPPELQQCGATQTIDQVKLYGSFVRGTFDLGAPVASALAFRAARRKVAQAIALARGPHPGPVQIEVPLRKPLEAIAPTTEEERALARIVAEPTGLAAPPRIVADSHALDELAAAIASEPRGVIIAGALPVSFAAARDALFALAARAGYPVLAEAGSQLRFGPRPDVAIDYFDLAIAAGAPAPRLIIQLGAEPVAASWSTAFPHAQRWVLAEYDWRDPDSSARGVIIGDVHASLAALVERIDETRDREMLHAWRALDARIASSLARAIAAHPRSEVAAMRAAFDALPAGAIVQLGNSLPIRIADLVPGGGAPRTVITQRGAAGIDGLIASAAGATRAGAPVLLVLGDVSFAHDLGGLLAAREASAPHAIVVVDNGGGRIFSGLPVARVAADATFERHFLTSPELDPAAVATALGIRAVTTSASLVGDAVATALAARGATVIHVPVTATGAHDVRRDALESLATRPSIAVNAGASHV